MANIKPPEGTKFQVQLSANNLMEIREMCLVPNLDPTPRYWDVMVFIWRTVSGLLDIPIDFDETWTAADYAIPEDQWQEIATMIARDIPWESDSDKMGAMMEWVSKSPSGYAVNEPSPTLRDQGVQE